jgi:LPS export ABC transporter protein LptC
VKPIGKVIGIAAITLGIAGLLGTGFWLFQPRKTGTTGQSGSDTALVDPSLRLTDVDLEQTDEQGNLLWKIKAKQAVYNREKKEGTIVSLNGELYQEGKVAFKISADKGEIKGDGKVISLNDNIVAMNVKDQVELKGKEMEWQTQSNLLKIKNKFIATHKNVKVTGKEGRYFTKKRLAELTGTIVADVKEPMVRMTTDKLNWNLEKEEIQTVAAVAIERRQDANLVDRAKAEKGAYNLKTKVARLEQAVEVSLAKPEVKVTGDELLWDTGKQLITAPKPIAAYSASEQMTVTANQGKLQINEQTAYLSGNVRGSSQKTPATIATDNLVWFLDKQAFEATGNVVYRQPNPDPKSPITNLVGNTATGSLTNQSVTLSGGPEADDRVVIDIVPTFSTP